MERQIPETSWDKDCPKKMGLDWPHSPATQQNREGGPRREVQAVATQNDNAKPGEISDDCVCTKYLNGISGTIN